LTATQKWTKASKLHFTGRTQLSPYTVDDDIPLPPGLPPGTEEVQSDDDIPMPDGPPPGQVSEKGQLFLSFSSFSI